MADVDDCDVDVDDLEIERVDVIDPIEPSSRAVPTPIVRTFEGVEQQANPSPSSQQNVPSEGSPQGRTTTFAPLSTMIDC